MNSLKKKILIVNANFYQQISELLLSGAIEQLKVENFDYEVVEVMGAFEIPAVIAFAAASGKYAGYIALGCVIRGETTHYDYVCMESARGLNELAIFQKLAIGYGIITVENEEQALIRAKKDKKDKGGFAALACVKMIELKARFSKSD
jgi:6,7-dimethyl-8-ribityllumazine synthase